MCCPKTLTHDSEAGGDSHPGILPPSTFQCFPLLLAFLLSCCYQNDVIEKAMNRLGRVNSLWREAEELDSLVPQVRQGSSCFPGAGLAQVGSSGLAKKRRKNAGACSSPLDVLGQP